MIDHSFNCAKLRDITIIVEAITFKIKFINAPIKEILPYNTVLMKPDKQLQNPAEIVSHNNEPSLLSLNNSQKFSRKRFVYPTSTNINKKIIDLAS